MSRLFDPALRALRRDRAARAGPELFLLERAFGDCLERLEIMRIAPANALLIGCPDVGWKSRLERIAGSVEVADPGPAFAAAAGGAIIVEDEWPAPPSEFDLIVAVGTLDTVNDLPRAFFSLAWALRPGAALIGAMSGGETLPLLRSAMAAADRAGGAARPHVHPRVEASALAGLLHQGGLVRPVVDVDRVPASYVSFSSLVRDLRAMGATNILTDRSRAYIGKTALAAAHAEFGSAASGGRSVETFEILHFAAWKPER